MNKLFTSESVTEGHPDKVADQVSDAVLDAVLVQDPQGRVACETLVTTGVVVISGEISTKGYIDIPNIARATIRDIGYDCAEAGFDGTTCAVITSIDPQSPDIAQGVDDAQLDDMGAGDQGMMFGYACTETPDLMPLPIWLAHRLAEQLSRARRSGTMPYLLPDGKTQVTVEYEDGKPKKLGTVVISSQHRPGVTLGDKTNEILEYVLRPVVPPELIDDKPRILINPTGRFELGGPQADAGLTGRKIIVDTYGGMARHGGGAFSGKDPTKVDRSAAYAARWIAKHIVAAGAAARCEIQLAYAIGVADPVSVSIEAFGTETVDPNLIGRSVLEIFDLRPAAIIQGLDLRRPIYKQTAAYGHFGRGLDEFTWESTPRLTDMRSALGL